MGIAPELAPVDTNKKADYEPKRRMISNVTNTVNALVTTTEPHGYIVGFIVTIFVPRDYGMAVNQDTYILSVPTPLTFVTALDLSLREPFVAPVFPPANQQAQVIPVSGVTRNVLQGPQ